jgi:hypothetical protein
MIYHTNHCWCSESNWNNECFDGEVMVSFGENIDTDSISQYDHKIIDPDFQKLTEKKKFFNEEEAREQMKIMKDIILRNTGKFNEEEFLSNFKERSRRKTVTLKPEIIQWLNDNVKDRKVYEESEESDSSLADQKGWCIGNDKYNSNQSYEITVFFARQVDALKFIRKFSIFKLPTFYFDYFREERREMESKKIIEIINKNSNEKINFNDYKFENDNLKETSTNLDYSTFQLLDWEKDEDENGYSDDIDMTPKEIQKAIKDILSVDNDSMNADNDFGLN